MTDETNVQQSMVTGKCEVCGVDIAPAKTEPMFKRNRGLHMYMSHGIEGQWRKNRLAKAERRKQLLEASKGAPVKSFHPTGTPEQRSEWARMAVQARWAKQKGVTPVSAYQQGRYTQEQLDLARDMTVAEVGQLTPEQKKIRSNVRKAFWYANRKKKMERELGRKITYGEMRALGMSREAAETRKELRENQGGPGVERRNLPAVRGRDSQPNWTDEEMHLMRPMT